jgi:CRP/FNR family transcriptional regulator/CRP/FNR family cyclic AMP-dependent transcriptional regulator
MGEHDDLLIRSDMFQGLDEGQIEAIVAIGECRSFGPGAEIVQEDETANAVFFLLSGRVDIEIRAAYAGRGPQRLATLKRGEVFGELSLVDGFLRSATARAGDAVEVLAFDNAKLEALMSADPTAGFRIMRNIANILGSRIRTTNMKLRNALSDILYY